MKARDILTRDVITVKPDTTLDEVARILTDKKISGLPVVNDEGNLVGIISEGDLLRKDSKVEYPSYINILGGILYLDSFHDYLEELKKLVAQKVEQLMQKDVVSISPEASVEDMATLMVVNNINRLPVVEDGKLVGIVTRADIIKSWVAK